MGAAGQAQPTVNVAPARAVLFDCLIDGAGGAPLLCFCWRLLLAGCCLAVASGTGPVRAPLRTRVDALEAFAGGRIRR